MSITKNYSARSAALRALKADGADPAAFTIREIAGGRFQAFPKTAAGELIAETIDKAKKAGEGTKHFPPANETRRNELVKAKAERQAREKAGKAAPASQPGGKRAAILAAAQAGKLPPVPDFSAETHRRFRPRLEELVALVKAKDVRKLKAFEINPISTSPKAMDRYRNLAVIAIQAQGKKAAAHV